MLMEGSPDSLERYFTAKWATTKVVSEAWAWEEIGEVMDNDIWVNLRRGRGDHA